jgi:hypothetical protein
LASLGTAFGNIGAASAAGQGLTAADLVSQILNRTKLGNIAQSHADIQDALGLMSMGQEGKAGAKLGVDPGSLVDPAYKSLAAELWMQLHGAPKDLGQGVARQLFPSQPPTSGPLANVYNRLAGQAPSQAAPAPDTGAPIAAGPMGSQVTPGGPTSSMTQITQGTIPPGMMPQPGSPEAVSTAMDVLTGKRKTPYEALMERSMGPYLRGEIQDPTIKEGVRRYILQEKEPTDAINRMAVEYMNGSDNPAAKEAWDALIASKKVPLERLLAMEQRIQGMGEKLDFAKQQYQETGKPKAQAETKKIAADAAKDFETGLAEIRKEAPKANELLIMNATDKASAKASQRLKIRNFFDRAISAEADPERKKVLGQQRDEEMKQYAPSGGLTAGKFNLGF